MTCSLFFLRKNATDRTTSGQDLYLFGASIISADRVLHLFAQASCRLSEYYFQSRKHSVGRHNALSCRSKYSVGRRDTSYKCGSTLSRVRVLYSAGASIMSRVIMLYPIEASTLSPVRVLHPIAEALCRPTECNFPQKQASRRPSECYIQ